MYMHLIILKNITVISLLLKTINFCYTFDGSFPFFEILNKETVSSSGGENDF